MLLPLHMLEPEWSLMQFEWFQNTQKNGVMWGPITWIRSHSLEFSFVSCRMLEWCIWRKGCSFPSTSQVHIEIATVLMDWWQPSQQPTVSESFLRRQWPPSPLPHLPPSSFCSSSPARDYVQAPRVSWPSSPRLSIVFNPPLNEQYFGL